jgi:hypothetical protein
VPISDTTPDVAARQVEQYRRMSPAEKLRRVSDLTLGACLLSLAGLRERYPDAPERDLLLRLAVLRLGAETVARAYGWVAPPDGA